MDSVKKSVIIVAGGTGSRMNAEVPKQMLLLAGKPVIVHTIERFLDFDPGMRIIVVLHSSLMEAFKSTLEEYGIKAMIELVEGGETRFHSVKNGLNIIQSSIGNENGIVGIHDAARPLVSMATLRNTYAKAEQSGNAIPCVPIAESLREISGTENRAVQRDLFRIIQTPQCFQLNKLTEAFYQEYHQGFTDDATVFEQAGNKINLVEGNPENIKITVPSDLLIAEVLLEQLK